MPLAAMLIPLLPSLIDGIMSIVNAIRAHAETPEVLKTQLDQIVQDLQAVNAKVQAVELP